MRKRVRRKAIGMDSSPVELSKLGQTEDPIIVKWLHDIVLHGFVMKECCKSVKTASSQCLSKTRTGTNAATTVVCPKDPTRAS